MAEPPSMDLRERVLAAVAGGVSCRQAAERSGVSAASVSRWRTREREQGDAQPRSQGGDRKSHQIDAHRATILALLKAAPDITIEELRLLMRPRH
jgi:transposase